MPQAERTTVRVTSPADEDLLLELLNSTPVVDGVRTDALRDGEADWLSAHGGSETDAETAALRRVRDAVQAVVRGDADAGTLAPLFRGIAAHPRWHGGTLTWELDARPDETLAARALLAWAAIAERGPGRLRPCANPDCRRFLHDRSNANSARWCSMATCGNRAKARRHYRRVRTSAG